MMGNSPGESGGDDNGSDGKKGGKRELSTSKRAAQNRQAQVSLIHHFASCCFPSQSEVKIAISRIFAKKPHGTEDRRSIPDKNQSSLLTSDCTAGLPSTQRRPHQEARGTSPRLQPTTRELQSRPSRKLPAARLHHQPAIATHRVSGRLSASAEQYRASATAQRR